MPESCPMAQLPKWLNIKRPGCLKVARWPYSQNGFQNQKPILAYKSWVELYAARNLNQTDGQEGPVEIQQHLHWMALSRIVHVRRWSEQRHLVGAKSWVELNLKSWIWPRCLEKPDGPNAVEIQQHLHWKNPDYWLLTIDCSTYK